MYGLLDIATSGLTAHRTRLEVASVNIANAESILGPNGEYAPFRARMALLAPGDPAGGGEMGVHVVAIEMQNNALRPRHQPWHPYADASGYVYYPDVDLATETVNSMEATRAYEANVMAAEAAKAMLASALRLLA